MPACALAGKPEVLYLLAFGRPWSGMVRCAIIQEKLADRLYH
jgi:hypothetical protein